MAPVHDAEVLRTLLRDRGWRSGLDSGHFTSASCSHDHGDIGHWTVETHILIDLQPSCLLLYVDRSKVQAAESTNKHTNRVDYHARYGAGGAGGLQEPRGATEKTFIVTALRS